MALILAVDALLQRFREIVIMNNMNKKLLSILVCALALSACKKDELDASGNTDSNQQITQPVAKQNEGTTNLDIPGIGNSPRNQNISVGTGNSNGNSNGNPRITNGNNSGNNVANNANNNNRNDNNGNNNVKTVFLKEAAGDVPGYGRGFYRYGKDPSQITDADLEDAYRAGYHLMYMPADLSQWRNQDLPQSYLNALDQGLSRMKNVNAILRFSYDYTAAGQDTNLAQVRRHIEQLRPILARNRDNIFVWQAGFIGAWGEWHSSANHLDTDQNKAEVFKALLNANNNGIYAKLQLRYPGDLMDFLNNSNLPKGVVFTGMHNDCFMAGTHDVGTYFPHNGRSSEALRSFVRANSIHQVFGGETCEPQAGARTSCADILREGREYHVSYLNYDYHKTFINNWESGSCMTEVRKRMGYRYVVEELSAYADQQNSNIIHWSAKIANRGWANAPDWGYRLYLVVNGEKILLDKRFSVQPSTAQSFRGSFLKSQLNGKAPILLIDTEDANYSGPHPLQFANADDANAQKVKDGSFSTGLALKWLLSI
ncbi:hypothetical protein A7P98_09610 [Eikenella sp. NML080894]|uniref:DUF4874 domain-containing protein n=1 Tax=Eikenella TaxID=538 RepID=UPI0007DEA543|nr:MULTISPECIES: DUF4874 domain-containing protein [Eikenella]OAM33629.1 hypothetical protein A7P98_09610 [Eikenella sp. NML080894]OAM35919.1 hypothetical protein A7P99_08895 [Eikenella sp. NML120348]OAM44936.1 hypothetical protein A7Q03_06940 [Eikenella sp. NML99-0057]